MIEDGIIKKLDLKLIAVDDEYTQRWFHYMSNLLPTGKKTLADASKYANRDSHTGDTLQLSVLFLNLGHIIRPMKPNPNKKAPSSAPRNEMLLNMWGGNWAHLVLACESADLKEIQNEAVEDFALRGAHSECGELSCYVRSNQHAATPGTVTLLHSVEIRETIAYAFFRVSFGTTWASGRTYYTNDEEREISRSGLTELTVAVFHLHHNCANNRLGRAAEVFTTFLQLCLDYRVDIYAGDANQAAFKCYNSQDKLNIPNSLISYLTRSMVAEVNIGKPIWQRLQVHMLNNNFEGNLTGEDPDCCVMAIWSWGRTQSGTVLRNMLRTRPEQERRDLANPHPHRERPHQSLSNAINRVVPSDDMLNTDDPHSGITDFDIRQSPRVLMIKHTHLWLNQSDMSWHLPILATIRELPFKNWRQKSHTAEKKKNAERSVFKAKQQSDRERQQHRHGPYPSTRWQPREAASEPAVEEEQDDESRPRPPDHGHSWWRYGHYGSSSSTSWTRSSWQERRYG